MRKCSKRCCGRKCKSFGQLGLEEFISQYIETALWSTNDESDERGGEPMDANYSASDFAPEAMTKMRADATLFYNANYTLWQMDADDSTAGHDFWLTRNGHGAGFWDGDYPTNGKELTKRSKKFGEVWLYVGDDGQIYV